MQFWRKFLSNLEIFRETRLLLVSFDFKEVFFVKLTWIFVNFFAGASKIMRYYGFEIIKIGCWGQSSLCFGHSPHILFSVTVWPFMILSYFLTPSFKGEYAKNYVKSRYRNLRHFLQGDPNQNFLFQMAMTLKICISDHILVKPKCVWHAQVYFSAVCLQFLR